MAAKRPIARKGKSVERRIHPPSRTGVIKGTPIFELPSRRAVRRARTIQHDVKNAPATLLGRTSVPGQTRAKSHIIYSDRRQNPHSYKLNKNKKKTTKK